MNFLAYTLQNLLMLAFMQFISIRLCNAAALPLALNNWHFALLVLSTVLIAAAGYVINDILIKILTSSINHTKSL
jgi:4-hydroxybenzoate polyprenyltransferase